MGARTNTVKNRVGAWLVVAISGFALPSFGHYSEPVDAKEFLAARSGTYQIIRVGGATPAKPETFDVDISLDPSEGAIYAPYCETGTGVCDLGYLPFAYPDTRVYKLATDGQSTVFEILSGSGPTPKRFVWEERDGHVFFRNYQYVLASTKEVITLEHEVVLTVDTEPASPSLLRDTMSETIH